MFPFIVLFFSFTSLQCTLFASAPMVYLAGKRLMTLKGMTLFFTFFVPSFEIFESVALLKPSSTLSGECEWGSCAQLW